METRILESSINKICSLLAVGFGDAGAEVNPHLRKGPRLPCVRLVITATCQTRSSPNGMLGAWHQKLQV